MAIAVSPAQRYSNESVDCGSSQPVPVAPATTRTDRSNAPVRSSSCTASAARSCALGAESTPTYTRIGSVAARPDTAVSSATVGPPPANERPCRPSVSQPTREDGLPERSGCVGRVTPGSVSWFEAPYTLSAKDTNPLNTTPVATQYATSATSTKPTVWASRAGRNRPRPRSTHCVTRRMPRAAVSTTTATTGAIQIDPQAMVGASGSPTRTRTWFCQTPPAISITTKARGPTTASPHQAPRLTRTGSSGTSTRRSSQLTAVPRPYPIAMLTPAMTPRNSGGRGSRDGVMAAANATTAPASPTYVNRCSQCTPRRATRRPRDGSTAPVVARSVSGTGVIEPHGSRADHGVPPPPRGDHGQTHRSCGSCAGEVHGRPGLGPGSRRFGAGSVLPYPLRRWRVRAA